MFVGYSVVGSNAAWLNNLSKESDIVSLSFSGMVIDELYATRNVIIRYNWELPESWEFETHLHGDFKETTYAGNVDYSEKIVQRVKIKKRFKGDFDWKTILEKEIKSINDFYIEFYDYLEPSRRDIEYAYVAVVNTPGVGTVDTDIATSSIRSEFDSYFLVGTDETYPVILDMSNDITYNRQSNIIVSPGSRYPYVVNNGIARYYSGTLKATFINLKDGDWDTDNGYSFRNQVDQFLTDGNTKILKTFEGDMYMINITGNIPRTVDGHYQHVLQELQWVEAGDSTSINDLYTNGFINTDIDRK